jgi:hypothetical protein
MGGGASHRRGQGQQARQRAQERDSAARMCSLGPWYAVCVCSPPKYTSGASAAGVQHGAKARPLCTPSSSSPPARRAVATAPPGPRRGGLETLQTYHSQGAHAWPGPRDRAGAQAPGTSFCASAPCVCGQCPFPYLCSCAEFGQPRAHRAGRSYAPAATAVAARTTPRAVLLSDISAGSPSTAPLDDRDRGCVTPPP